MFTCAALMLALTAADLPSLAGEVEAEARALAAHTQISPAFIAGLEEFSADAEALSGLLRQTGAAQDLPCIFHGIAEDSRARAADLQAAATPAERDAALAELRVLLDDAIALAPMAAAATE